MDGATTPLDIADLALNMAETLRHTSPDLPGLFVDTGNLPGTALALRDHLARRPMLFDRGVPVRLAFDPQRRGMAAEALTPHGVTREAHAACVPYVIRRTKEGENKARITLPERVAHFYLDMRGEFGLRPLNGIACSPLLAEDGGIRTGEGYDEETRLWRERVPEVAVCEAPSRAEAEATLRRLRLRVRTFCFGDATITTEPSMPVPVVDIEEPPGQDESTALLGFMTAVCRPSLDLAPGILIRGAAFSGAGTGKGLLARCICAVAFGRRPSAMTAGHNAEEQEKRLTSALVGAEPVVLLDNVNATALRSDTLASALTERPAHVRPFGKTATVPLNSAALIIVTGNALTVSEDLARRFLAIELDAGTENPESRTFPGNLLAEIFRDRVALLADVLTIWRWGRQQGDALTCGKALGSFETWTRWCRDPLLALGCADPVERIAAAKAEDPRRRAIAELFGCWWEWHRAASVTVAGLHPAVTALLDQQGRGRQYLAVRVQAMTGTRAAGFVLTRADPVGTWGAATYALHPVEPDGVARHRDHREHGGDATAPSGPMPPMPPMVSDPEPIDEVVL
jgi:hypothetical protein